MELGNVNRSLFPQEAVPDHAVYLSFYGDQEAAHFLDWLYEQGWDDYLKYLDEQTG